jgi:hypothetical protein
LASLTLEFRGVKSIPSPLNYVIVATLSSMVTATACYVAWTRATPSAAPSDAHAAAGQSRKKMSADTALAIAIKRLAERKVVLPEKYSIEITRSDNDLTWRIWFVAVPAAFGGETLVTVTEDGKAFLAVGK